MEICCSVKSLAGGTCGFSYREDRSLYLKSFACVIVKKTFQVTCGVASFQILKVKLILFCRVPVSQQIWTPSGFGPPYQTFLKASFVSYLVTDSICKLFYRCYFQSQDNISSIKVKQKNKQKKQPFRSNSTAFLIASRNVYARIRCEQTTAFELLRLL